MIIFAEYTNCPWGEETNKLDLPINIKGTTFLLIDLKNVGQGQSTSKKLIQILDDTYLCAAPASLIQTKSKFRILKSVKFELI